MRRDDYDALIRVANETNSVIQVAVCVTATYHNCEKLEEEFTTALWVEPNDFTWEEFTELMDWSSLYIGKNLDMMRMDGRSKAFNDVFEKYVPYSENFDNRVLEEVDIGLYRCRPRTK